MSGRVEELTSLRWLVMVWALCAATPALPDPEVHLLSDAQWSLDQDWFGGFSGIEVTHNGTAATLITDKGRLVEVRLHRRKGSLAGVELMSSRPLRHKNGHRLAGLSHDAEGLALASDTSAAFISFEHRHRVASVDLGSGRTVLLPISPAFQHFQPNAGLEALALHPDGSLYTLSERSHGRHKPFDLHRLSGPQWHAVHKIPRRGPFLPVGADFDAQGLFYLLERAVTPLGFRSRIRRFDLADVAASETILLKTLPGRFDNLEGLSVWQDKTGRKHLTLISDDNFLTLQKTQIVEYRLTE